MIADTSPMAVGPPPQIQVMQMIMAAMPSRTLGAVAQLAIPDVIGNDARNPAEVAEAIGAFEPWVRRIMRAAASLGVLQERGDGSFENTPLGDALRSDTPGSVRALGVLANEPFHFMAWGGLAAGVRTGEVPFEHVHGTTFFDYLRDNPDANEKFAAWMTQTSKLANEAIVASYDFSTANTIIDVGGGQGALLAAVLARAPQAKGILFDTPEVVADTSPLEGACVQDRCAVVGGDFFESVPSGGDLLMLRTVLHDWDDDDCVRILCRCREAAGPGTSLLILEMVLPGECSPHPGFIMDINMLVLNHGGRERTAAEYGDLLARAGYRMEGTTPTPSPMSIVEATAV
ncbi:MAG: hypothetical protein IT198_07460 [Acidimicrobiia bacterium]|nr:hypothetical protein [Acidimicrobiia bacterium]